MTITMQQESDDGNFLQRGLKGLSENLKFLYMDYFLSAEDPTYENFKEHHLDVTAILLDLIDEKYAEWIEGKKRDIMEK